jgi:putative oxidoreductase
MSLGIRLNQLLKRIAGNTAFIPSLLLRFYLAPVFWVAGTNKLANFDSTVEWFGNPDWGLGLPMPWLMALLATATEVIGSILLLLGLGTRYISIPLMITMLVAAFTVHWQNGWQAVADSSSAFASDKLGFLQLEDASGVVERLQRARSILQEHGNYDWLTETGSIVISNNGIEWAASYFVMLLALFALGGGRYVSLDDWIGRRFRQSHTLLATGDERTLTAARHRRSISVGTTSLF